MNHDQPIADENIESSKLEWGPELGQMSWDNAQTKIAELNSGLAEGEKPWRLPTADEFKVEHGKNDSIVFQKGHYLTSIQHPKYNYGVMVFYPYSGDNGDIANGYKEDPEHYIRCVR